MVLWIRIKCKRGKKKENWIVQLQNAGGAWKRRNWHSELIEKTLKEKNVYIFMTTHAETFDVVERSVTVVSRNGFHQRSNVNNNLLVIRIHWIELNFSDAFHFIAERERLRFFQPQWWRRVPEPRIEIPLICKSFKLIRTRFTDQVDL